MSGIGKTTLVKKFVDSHLQNFEFIIWKKFSHPKSLDLLIDDVLKALQPQVEVEKSIDDKLKQLFSVFTKQKCLIVLDDIHNIFAEEQFSGQYQTAYQSYQTLFTLISETDHQSHVILMSQEKCSEMDNLDDEIYSIRCLELMGLNDPICFKKTSENQDIWLQIIDLYEGNPFYIKEISLLVKDVFEGQIEDFFSAVMSEQKSPILTSKMRSHFDRLLNRLAPIERLIILEFSKFDRPLARGYFLQALDISLTDFMNGLQSLKRRYIVRQIANSTNANEVLFQLSPVLQQYIIDLTKGEN
ncbi:NB-ARC domain-containing protein [Oscillatoria salina]|uniref:NB-ARC domain-containing protein n=1 Tax=Oscillatoria salina TaxID=331517 RepID=UPI001CCC0A72|nr:NB-ARC domain-containing protein [Oscillatoria salina]MBZ8181105.1 AAA family ATPase [Oscillatoria salina IIICB1]